MIPFAVQAILGGVWKRITGAFAWAVANPWPALAALGLAVALFQTWRLSDARADEKRAVEALAGFREAMHVRLTNAFLKAKQAERANLARVAEERKAINETVVTKYVADATDWRARFERLRRDQANRGSARNDNLPAVTPAPGQTPQPYHDPAGFVSVRVEDLEVLVLGALQGEAIRQWAIANEAVETSEVLQ